MDPDLPVQRSRLESLDGLRGLVMVLMALDHTRDFFGTSSLDPRGLDQPALFLTRWMTHFCAPVFVFLAGTSAWLYGRRGKSRADLGRFLVTRGLWLVFLEWTVIRVAWTFDFVPGFLPMQVIWAIGWSMVGLALLIRLPAAAVGGIGAAVVAGHGLLDPVAFPLGSAAHVFWTVLHGFGPLPGPEGVQPFVAYALVPWLGVIASGYGFGALLDVQDGRRGRRLLAIGVALTCAFVALRALNGYGDPRPWQVQASYFGTLLAFLGCEKYPPSLLFLLMTLGPSIALLGLAELGAFRFPRWLVTVGRVPLFYYVLHLFLIHALAVAAFAARGWPLASLLEGFHPMTRAEATGFALPFVYAAWMLVVLALYPLCRWFAAVKQRRSEWWLSYL